MMNDDSVSCLFTKNQKMVSTELWSILLGAVAVCIYWKLTTPKKKVQEDDQSNNERSLSKSSSATGSFVDAACSDEDEDEE